MISTLILVGLSSCSLRPGKAYYIPAGSMEPTLAINDRIFVDLNAYEAAAPRRGEIVVFKPTATLQQAGFTAVFIKRIVGLPGERVSLVNGKVYVNGKPLAEPYLAADTKTQAELCSPEVVWLNKPQMIPPNHYLMLGDNRNNSFDGRCWGLVPRDHLVGRATMIYWPPNHYGSLDGK
jgi:signal peptidase I